LLACGVSFANGGRVLVLLFGRHQISLGSLGAIALVNDFVFQAAAVVLCLVALVFQSSNLKGALIELVFDLGAPLGYRFQLFF
jgi:hypothetical protein